MENLWAIVAREVEKHACDDEALGDAVIKAWNEVCSDVFVNLAHSIPARCAAVIAAGGHHTKY